MNAALAQTSFYDLTYARFCALHFLEFAVWGAWYVVLGNFLDARGFSRKDIGRIYGTMAVGAIISPMFVGAIADRYLSTQLVIGGLHLVGAVLLFAMSRLRNARPFYWTALVYSLAYSPTLALVNSIVFANIPEGVEAGTYFPLIRVFGTIGWILAGLSLKLLLKPNQPVNERPLLLAACLSAVLGGYAFSLPDTPPAFPAAVANAVDTGALTQDVAEKLLEVGNVQQAITDGVLTAEQATGIPKQFEFADVFGLIGQLPVFLLVSFIISMAMGFYFAFGALFLEKNTNVDPQNVGPIMAIGQIVEIAFMLSLPWFLATLGMPMVLGLGVAAWALRFGFFSLGSMPLVVAGIALHGICFDFFFAAGFIHVDAQASEAIRNSAQTLYGMMVYGIGLYLGNEIAGWLNQHCTVESMTEGEIEPVRRTNWRKFWAIPCVAVTVSLLLMIAAQQLGGSTESPALENPDASETAAQ